MSTEAVVLRVILKLVLAEQIFNDSISTTEFPSRVHYVAVVLTIIPSVKVYNALPKRVVYVIITDTSYHNMARLSPKLHHTETRSHSIHQIHHIVVF